MINTISGSTLTSFLVLVGVSLSGHTVVAQEPVDVQTATPMMEAALLESDEQIVLDGRLDEAVWTRGVPARDFLQTEPVEGVPGTERTEVRVAYDADNFYIGAMLADSEPDGILGYQKQRDAGLGSDDRFMWVLDTFLDGRTGYFFEINPAGLMGDGLLRTGSGRTINKSWDGIWEARVARGAYGWSAEVRIPFRTLNFDRTLETWGINFQRTVRRKNEETLWSGHLRNQGLFRPTHAGRVSGLQGMSQGIGLEAKPYVAGAWKYDAEAGSDVPADIGVDVTYSVASSLRAAVTVNTDFAETEVDQRRVNLTRFPLFFPERRAFFLEGSSVFNFATTSGVTPFFSRRIGLVDGEPTPIRYGARLGGQLGRNELGFLQVQTGGHGLQPAETFTVGRFKRNFFAQSSIGAIYTRRGGAADLGLSDAEADELELSTGQTLGVDLDLFTSTFLGDKNLQFEAFYVGHTASVGDESSSGSDRSARGVRLNYPNDRWRANISYRELGDDYDPAVGFVRRNGFKRLQPTVTFQPRPARLTAVRQLEFQVFFERLADLDNRLQTRRLNLKPLGVFFHTGDRIEVDVRNRFEHLDEVFEIQDGVELPIGDYSFTDWEVSARSASRRPISGRVSYGSGGFWSGSRTQMSVDLTVRPRPGLRFSTDWERDIVELDEGTFTTNLVRVEGAWHLSPWASVTGNLQYDNVSELLGMYTRLRWILEPGSDLFFVYTQNWQNEPNGLVTLSRGATTKINYTHRF